VAGAERLAGLVAAVDESRGLVAVVSPAGLAEVWAGGAVILLIEEQSGGLAERLIPLGELAEGMRLEVEGGTAPERPARLLVATREDRGRDRR
jgi:hypothetical protein